MAKKNRPLKPSPPTAPEAEARRPADPLAAMTDAEKHALGQAVMRRQLALSLRVFLVFAALLFGLPLVNWLLPQIAQARVGGFTLTWLFLGVLFYPLTWALSAFFIRESNRIEHDLAERYGSGGAAR